MTLSGELAVDERVHVMITMICYRLFKNT